MVKTSLSNAQGADLIPGQEAKIPHALRPKKPRHKSEAIFNNKFNKTLKMVQIKKKSFIKRDNENSRAEIYSQI